MQKLRVGIVLDNPKRDLRGMLILAHELLNLGCEVALVPFYTQNIDLFSLNLDVVLLNYARHSNRKLITELKEIVGCQIFVLDSEGGLLGDDGPRTPERLAMFLKNLNLRNYLDGVMLWGIKAEAKYKELSGLDPAKIFVTGAPRYDLCNSQFRELLQYGKSGFVLINTNFAWINPKFAPSKEAELKNTQNAGFPIEYTKILFSEFENAFNASVAVYTQLFKDFPEVKFVLRPHPFESELFYREKFADFKNVSVESIGEIYDVVDAGLFMVHLNCGTAVDAVLLNKAPISIEYLNTEFLKKFVPTPSQISLLASNYDELKKLMAERLQNKELQNYQLEPSKMHLVTEQFNVSDGKNSLRIAKILAGALPKKKPTAFSVLRKKAATKNFKFFILYAASTYLYVKFRSLYDHKWATKFFSREDVVTLLAKIESIGKGRYGSVEVALQNQAGHFLPTSSFILKRKDG